MEKNVKKDLLIKGNAVKRLLKEYKMYETEVTKLQTKYDQIKNEGEDDYQLKKQNEFLLESIAARDAVKPKLRNMADDLTSYLSDIPDEAKESDEYKNAIEYLELVKTAFSTE
jgi:tubulin-specific chaperone A